MRALALPLLLLAGCSFDDFRAGELCPEGGSCGPGLACVRGLCAVPDEDRGLQPPAPERDAGPIPADATARPDARIPADAFRNPPMDAAAPTPDRFVPPAPPEDQFVPPPPPPDAAPPPPPDLPVGPQLGLPGCRGDAWCVYADGDATILESEPDQNLDWLLGVSNGWDGVPDGDGLVRFELGELAGREAYGVGLYLDTSFADVGDRDGRGSRLEVERVDPRWDQRTVTWRTPLQRVAGPIGVTSPRRGPAAPIRWELVSLLPTVGDPSVRLPDAIAFRIHEEGNGRFLFVSREEAAERRERLPPRLELLLVP